ncbi:MAG: aminopeptidase P family protein [Deltaproteobacteria bacterium]|nr:aminopeptidase P family protein [Deltaproteobacteria bacterium]
MGLSLRERDRRAELVRRAMRAQGLHALVVAGSTMRKGHLQYLTDYTISFDSAYLVHPLEGEPTLFVFTRNQEQHARRSWVSDARFSPDYGRDIAERLRELGASGKGVGVVGLDVMSAQVYCTIQEQLPQARLADAGEIIMAARALKSEEEAALIRESAVMADGAYAAAQGRVRPGAVDHEVFAEMDYYLKQHGVIEAFNLATAEPLPAFPYLPVGQTLRDGEAILLEITPRYQGYYAQLTVAAPIGRRSAEREQMVRVARGALEKGVEQLRPGRRACDVAVAMKAVVEAAGFTMPQRGGHGVGLEVDEPPALIPQNERPLQEGMSVVVHPSVVIPGRGGVFLGGSYLVTRDGCEKLYKSELQ